MNNKNDLDDQFDFQIEEIESPHNSAITNNKNQNTSNLLTSSCFFKATGALQLIEFKKKSFILNKEALDFLNSIEEEIVVVSIVGKARTGKSFLMNLLLETRNEGSGFEVASTINSCTRGIWLWNDSKQKPNSHSKILFIDSEGTNSVDLSTKTYDAKIFALVVLLSSLLIYNTHGNIDETSIGELALAAHLSSAIALSAKVDKDDAISQLAPKFVWVLRDFTLDKIDPETNEEISSDEYLELCLKKKISGKNSQENNLIRDNIIKYFKERECVTLPRPVDNEEDLQKLKTIPFSKLKSNFRNEFSVLKRKVYEESKEKRINNQKLNGPKFAKLLVAFIDAINAGCIPNITSAWDNIIQTDIENHYKKCHQIFKEEHTKLQSQTNLALQAILQQYYKIKYNLLTMFKEILYLNREIEKNEDHLLKYKECEEKLENEIDRAMTKEYDRYILKKNDDVKREITGKSKVISNKMFSDKYDSKEEFDELIKDYMSLIIGVGEKVEGVSNQEIDNVVFKAYLTHERDILFYIITKVKEEIKAKKISIEMELKKNEFDLQDKRIKQLNDINKTYLKKFNILKQDNQRKEKEISELESKLRDLQKEKEENSKNMVKMSLRKKNLKTSGDNFYIPKMNMEGEEKGCECGEQCFVI